MMRSLHAAAAVTALLLTTSACSSTTDSDATVATAPSPVTTATIERGSLSTEREFTARVSFGDPWALNTTATGTVTGRHEIGTVVHPGDELLRVDDRPLFLARGLMPMYRELRLVDTRVRDENNDRLKLLEGYDVIQLQQFLLAAGHDAAGRLEANAVFDTATETALEAWQASVDLPATGTIDASSIVFHPEAVRIASAPRLGDGFAGLEVSVAKATVHVDTSNRDRAALPLDAEVGVDIAGQPELIGTVIEQEQVVGSDGQRVWRTTVDVEDGILAEEGTAEVTAIETLAIDVLIAPVGSLIALAEGGYAVEVPDEGLARVTVGEVLQGRAEIDGDLEAGTTVVVPT